MQNRRPLVSTAAKRPVVDSMSSKMAGRAFSNTTCSLFVVMPHATGWYFIQHVLWFFSRPSPKHILPGAVWNSSLYIKATKTTLYCMRPWIFSNFFGVSVSLQGNAFFCSLKFYWSGPRRWNPLVSKFIPYKSNEAHGRWFAVEIISEIRAHRMGFI